MPAAQKNFRVLNERISYPDGAGGEKSAVLGEIVDDLPKSAVVWMEEQGVIERTSDPVGPAPEVADKPVETNDEDEVD